MIELTTDIPAESLEVGDVFTSHDDQQHFVTSIEDRDPANPALRELFEGYPHAERLLRVHVVKLPSGSIYSTDLHPERVVRVDAL